MSDVNSYGELAEWDTASREYRKKIKRLTRLGKRYPSEAAMGAYRLGIETWEHARAAMGIESDPNDPRWGRFFVRGAEWEYQEMMAERRSRDWNVYAGRG